MPAGIPTARRSGSRSRGRSQDVALEPQCRGPVRGAEPPHQILGQFLVAAPVWRRHDGHTNDVSSPTTAPAYPIPRVRTAPNRKRPASAARRSLLLSDRRQHTLSPHQRTGSQGSSLAVATRGRHRLTVARPRNREHATPPSPLRFVSSARRRCKRARPGPRQTPSSPAEFAQLLTAVPLDIALLTRLPATAWVDAHRSFASAGLTST